MGDQNRVGDVVPWHAVEHIALYADACALFFHHKGELDKPTVAPSHTVQGRRTLLSHLRMMSSASTDDVWGDIDALSPLTKGGLHGRGTVPLLVTNTERLAGSGNLDHGEYESFFE